MVIFTDIDDTIMQTKRKFAPSTDFSLMMPGAVNFQGENNSFIDSQRLELIKELLLKQDCIAVSARTRAGYNNLLLTFNSYAILNFGGTIIDKNKQLVQDWHRLMINASKHLQQASVFENIEQMILDNKLQFDTKVANEDDVSFYMVCRSVHMNLEHIEQLKTTIVHYLTIYGLHEQFYFYQTDRDLTIIPAFIKKEKAVAYLMQHYYNTNELTIGIGDHLNDLSFMQLCNFVMVPTDSSLMKLIQKNIKK